MLTDDEARGLLQLAGETVPVDPTRTLPEPPRRPLWPVLVAAAAVVAIAVTSLVFANRDGGSPSPDPAPPVPTSVQVPSVLGYAQDDAVRTLMEAGFPVSTKVTDSSCDQAYIAAGTDPAAGTSLNAGSTVVLQVTTPTDGYCVDDSATLARELLNFADGRGPAPQLAGTITIYDENGSAEITAAQAADPETWRACSAKEVCTSVLADLSAAAHAFYLAPGSEETRYVSPVLTASTQHHSCPYNAGPEMGRFSVRIQVLSTKDGPVCTDTAVDVYRDSDDRIDAVVLRTLGSTAVATSPIEDLAHQLVDFALSTGGLPPIGDEVGLYVGGAFTGLVTSDSATDRTAWQACTETGRYADRDCPFSPLDVLREFRGLGVSLVDGNGATCLKSFQQDPGIASADSITIVPFQEPYLRCAPYAVRLYVNDDDELIAVNLLLPKKE
jgi:hypothetical protein